MASVNDMVSEQISSSSNMEGSNKSYVNVQQQPAPEDGKCHERIETEGYHNNLTEEEERVLGLDHWIDVYSRINSKFPLIQADKDILGRVTALVRKAYVSLKETRGVIIDIAGLLHEKDARNAFTHFVFCFSRMDEYSELLEELRLTWVQDYPHIFVDMDPFVGRSKFTADINHQSQNQEASIKPSSGRPMYFLKLEEPGKGEKEAISDKIYSILLILREILTKTGVQPQGAEGNERAVEGRCDELMRVVVDGAFQLTNVIGKTDRMVTKMLDSVYKEFPADSHPYKLALASDKKRYDWTVKFSDDLSNSIWYISKDSAAIYKFKFQKLIDTIDPWCIFWYLNK